MPIEMEPDGDNAGYLRAKRDKMGHILHHQDLRFDADAASDEERETSSRPVRTALMARIGRRRRRPGWSTGSPHGRGVAGFHRDLGERLLEGARARLAEAGLPEGHLEERWVPGAFELPLAARMMALRGRYAAVIALGAVIRGETSHFDHICHAAATGLSARRPRDRRARHLRRPDDREPRAGRGPRPAGDVGNAGADAADAAVVMANLVREGR